jgi:hypothetical protein
MLRFRGASACERIGPLIIGSRRGGSWVLIVIGEIAGRAGS